MLLNNASNTNYKVICKYRKVIWLHEYFRNIEKEDLVNFLPFLRLQREHLSLIDVNLMIRLPIEAPLIVRNYYFRPWAWWPLLGYVGTQPQESRRPWQEHPCRRPWDEACLGDCEGQSRQSAKKESNNIPPNLKNKIIASNLGMGNSID